MAYKGKQSRHRKVDYSSDEDFDTVIYEDLKSNNNDNKKQQHDTTNTNQLKETQLNNIQQRKKIFHDRKIPDDNDSNTNDNDDALKKFIENSSILIGRNKSDNSTSNQQNNETIVDFLELDHCVRRESYPNYSTTNNNINTTNNDFDLNDYSPKPVRSDKSNRKDTNKSNLTSNASKNNVRSLFDVDMDRPSHWKSSSARPKLDTKNTKKKRRSDPILKQRQALPITQIATSGSQNISFQPSWLPQMKNTARNTNANTERMNDEIQENDDHDIDANYHNTTRRNTLEFNAGVSVGSFPLHVSKGSSPSSGKKRKRAIAGSYCSKYQKIFRCTENDEARLININYVPSKDATDPRNRVEFWIDVRIDDEAIFKDPFKIVVITIEALGVNDDKIKAKNQKFQHDLKLDHFDEDSYINMLLTKFQVGSSVVAYFKSNEHVNNFREGQMIRIYEPELCNFINSMHDNNNDDNTTCLLCTQLCELLQ